MIMFVTISDAHMMPTCQYTECPMPQARTLLPSRPALPKRTSALLSRSQHRKLSDNPPRSEPDIPDQIHFLSHHEAEQCTVPGIEQTRYVLERVLLARGTPGGYVRQWSPFWESGMAKPVR